MIDFSMCPPPIKMPKKDTEAKIEAYLVRKVKALGGECYKWSSMNVRGVTDRIVILPGGVVWFVEVKTKTGRMSPLQKAFAARMVELRVKNYVVLWCREDIDNWLDWVRTL